MFMLNGLSEHMVAGSMSVGVTENVDRVSATLRAAEIVQSLEEEIALGELRPRQRLVEEELVERFHAKRHVVRQALVDLETMGVVQRLPNKGATVRDFTPNEVEDIYMVRELVERRAAELVTLPASPKLIAQLTRIHSAHRAAAKRRDLRVVFRQNLLFHRTFFAACDVPPLVEVIEQFALKAHAIRSYTIGHPDLLEQVCRDHEQIIEFMRFADRARLIALVTAHIQPAKRAYLEAAAYSRARVMPSTGRKARN
jgi:DNA-binding GntR family transcriptional regulator